MGDVNRRWEFYRMVIRGVLHRQYGPMAALRVMRGADFSRPKHDPWADVRAQIGECGHEARFPDVDTS